jgi:uncharacterized cofD-like protein
MIGPITWPPPRPEGATAVRVVAFGGGHGLAACLSALRRLDGLDITAVVTVGDDGGSSGRLRAERDALPPGDLRMALAALAEDDPLARATAQAMQHRFTGSDPLAGHAMGNLLLHGLMEAHGDPVAALDHAAALLRARGRVLPMAPVPVRIEAEVCGGDPDHPHEVRVVRGQHAVAVCHGEVLRLTLHPDPVPACAEAVAAVEAADWLLFGPGSWYTSVLPHLLVPDLAAAIVRSPARRLVTLNLATETETHGLSQADHLRALTRYLPALRADVVLADGKAAGDPEPLHRAAESLGARLILAPVAVEDGGPRHEPAALAAALAPLLGDQR